MIDGLNAELTAYLEKWHKLTADCQNKEFFTTLKPVAAGWKVQDRAKYNALLAQLHDQADIMVETWLNGRWICKLHFKNDVLASGISIIKIMERRPGSTDSVGLDHVDFYSPTDYVANKAALAAEPGLQWTEETNDAIAGYDWLSVWFETTEAKIKNSTVLNIVVDELQAINKAILS